jgi:hypothetical protein
VPSWPQPWSAQSPLPAVATPPAASRGARRPSAQSWSPRSAAVDTGSTIVRANRATADTSRDATKPQREQPGRLGRIIFVACNRDATELPPCIHPGMHARLSLHRLAGGARECPTSATSGRFACIYSFDKQIVGTASPRCSNCRAPTLLDAVNNLLPRRHGRYRKPPGAQGNLHRPSESKRASNIRIRSERGARTLARAIQRPATCRKRIILECFLFDDRSAFLRHYSSHLACTSQECNLSVRQRDRGQNIHWHKVWWDGSVTSDASGKPLNHICLRTHQERRFAPTRVLVQHVGCGCIMKHCCIASQCPPDF